MASRLQEEQLIVAQLSDVEARRELRSPDWQVQLIDSASEVLNTEFRRPPRLYVIEATPADDPAQLHQLLGALRKQRPLTDVLLWAPQASGELVRSLFHSGVKDVVVSHSVPRLLERMREVLHEQQILPQLNELSRQRSSSARFEAMLSRSDAMWDLFELCTRIAPTEATALIVGETGTGKELLARAVHRRSGRQGRFVAANCASVPPELINSELFGHEKGAFTGADRAKQGLVTHANGGTLFLDEIGDMPPEGQQSLLRMLQERRIRPVGSLSEREVNVRVVAATNVPLDQAVSEGNFREDLFYRLDVIRMNVPPLRERPEDILFLFGYFTKQLSKHYGFDPLTYTDSFLEALTEYPWPGNVRQLQNLCERLVLSRPRRSLTGRDFSKLRSTSLARSRPVEASGDEVALRQRIDTSLTLEENLDPAIAEIEHDYLTAVLGETGGRVARAAQQAGISRRTLLRKMKAYGIDKEAFKTESK